MASGFSLPAVEQALRVSAGTVKVWLFEAGCRRAGERPTVLAS
jgi:hypothetical protein